MNDLFQLDGGGGAMRMDAVISPCGQYRYQLTREWDANRPNCCFIGLNPSTADATVDDPTIRRCINFAKAWGMGSLTMVNLFAFRATDPRDMKAADEPVGSANDGWILRSAARSVLTIAAWGIGGDHLGRASKVMALVHDLQCLGFTVEGFPRHPLYIPKTAEPTPYRRPTE